MSYTYKSPEAPTIEKEINRRLHLIDYKRSDARKGALSDTFQKKLRDKIQKETRNFKVGNVVRLTQRRVGRILYSGFVHFAVGSYYGIELIEGEGDHDGEYDGIRYFSTSNKKGVLEPESQVLRIVRSSPSSSSNNQKSNGNGEIVEDATDEKEEKQWNKKQSFSINTLPKLVEQTGNVQKRVSMTNIGSLSSGKPMLDDMLQETIFDRLKTDLLKSDTPEGNSRLRFLQGFQSHAKDDNLLSA
ncbi:hypothetical protein RFI_11156, partial [Reticulomyxa filosa]